MSFSQAVCVNRTRVRGSIFVLIFNGRPVSFSLHTKSVSMKQHANSRSLFSSALAALCLHHPSSLLMFHLVSSLKTLLLVVILDDFFIRWRWVVTVGWRWRVGPHHHLGGARLWTIRSLGQCHPRVTSSHPVHPKALYAAWLLGNCKHTQPPHPHTHTHQQEFSFTW